MTQDDDGFVFDESFVNAAARREGTADERAEKARRVARDHANVLPFRNTGAPPKPGTRPGKGSRSRKAFVIVTTIAVVAGALALRPGLMQTGLDTKAAAAAQPHPPRPHDASSHRLLPAVTGPAGAGGYAFMPELTRHGKTVLFSPCRPIHYVVRHDREPVYGPEVVTQAFAEISRRTGLTFVNDGSTDEKPDTKRPLVDQKRYGNRWSPILVAWATVAEGPMLKGDVDGYAGPRAADDDGVHLVSAQVVLDEAQLTTNGAAYPTLLHELGHAMGLAHVNDRAQLMYPTDTGQRHFGAGDLRGLAAAGAGPCGALGG